MMKAMKVVFVFLLVVVVGLWLGKNVIAKVALTNGIRAITGLGARVDRMDIGLVNTFVGINGLQVLNPPGFSDPVMVDVPEIYIDYKLAPFFAGNAHFERLRLELRELYVIKAADGKVNLHSVPALQSSERVKQEAKQQQAGRQPDFHIDILELQVGRVVYKDYTKTPVQTREFAVNINERYEHVSNPHTFAALVVSRALTRTAIAQLTNVDVAGLQAAVSDALDVSASTLTDTLGKSAETAGKVGQGAVDTATEAVKDTAETIKGLFTK